MLGETVESVAAKAEGAPVLTENQKQFFSSSATATAAPPKKAAPAKKAAAAKVTPAKAPAKPAVKAPSKELLESTEKAKAQVQKVGVKETKERLGKSKVDSTSPSSTPQPVVAAASTSTEVADPKKPGGKRRFAKGVTLILAAGAVAVGRNVVKAYLGRGLL